MWGDLQRVQILEQPNEGYAMNRFDFSDNQLAEHVKRALEEGGHFSLTLAGKHKHAEPLKRALRALSSAPQQHIRFLDILRVGTQIGCLGLVIQNPQYDWSYSEGDGGEILVQCWPKRSRERPM